MSDPRELYEVMPGEYEPTDNDLLELQDWLDTCGDQDILDYL